MKDGNDRQQIRAAGRIQEEVSGVRENVLGNGGLGIQGRIQKQPGLHMQLEVPAEAQDGERERGRLNGENRNFINAITTR